MLKKRFLKNGRVRVTFCLPDAIVADAKEAYLVGDFNNWNEHATPMARLENGGFEVTLRLEQHRDYQFRYLVNNCQWHCDWDADRYVASPMAGNNAIISTYPE